MSDLSQAIRRGYRPRFIKVPIKQVEEPTPVPVITVEKPPQMIAAADPEPPPPKFPSLNFIVETVTEFYGITVAQLASEGRTANLMRPRQIAAYLARTLTPRSFPVIGLALGGRDHTTIMHAFNKISALRQVDDELRDEILYLTEILTTAQPQAD